MCALGDTVVGEVIQSICGMEDISSDDSIQLQAVSSV